MVLSLVKHRDNFTFTYSTNADLYIHAPISLYGVILS
jgi:hypothetical protein